MTWTATSVTTASAVNVTWGGDWQRPPDSSNSMVPRRPILPPRPSLGVGLSPQGAA